MQKVKPADEINTRKKGKLQRGKRVYYGLKFAGMCLTGRRHAFFAIDMRQRVCVAFCLPCISKKRVFSFFATVKNRIVQLNSVKEFCNEVLTSERRFFLSEYVGALRFKPNGLAVL